MHHVISSAAPSPSLKVRALSFAVLAGLLAGFFFSTPAHGYPSSTVEIEGHGFGHGLGLGAWGAHGMAVRNPGKPGEDIAAYYFSGSRVDRAANDDIRAWLEFDTPLVDTIVTAGDPAPLIPRNISPFTIWDLAGGVQHGTADAIWSFWRVRAEGGSLRIQRALNSAGDPGGWEAPEQQVATVDGPVEFRPAGAENPFHMLQVQFSASPNWRYFRGSVRGVLVGGEVRTVSVATVQEYLYGVMRVEGSPSRWDGPGREGLRALAIVARSYALNKRAAARAAGQPYDICSTSNCQNYRGWGFVNGSGQTVQVEDDRTNFSVDTTTFEDGALKALFYGSDPVPVLGAYSSSSGGYTKPGPHPYLAAVPDPDDNIPENPSHYWRRSIPVAEVERAWPTIGSLLSFEVTRRNGYGDWGGRVLEARIGGTSGSRTVSGGEVEARLGLRSDWFRVIALGGYWMVASDGGIFSFGNANFYGSTGGMRLNQPIVGMAAAPDSDGYWLVATDGGIFTFGNAGFYGSTGGMRLNQPIVGMAATPDGDGYWLVASDGGIFTFGNAGFYGSTGGTTLNQPIVGMATTPSGGGYWLVARDGGIFTFGDAEFHGSTGNIRLNQPIVGMAATPSGHGYWLVARDGGIFTFGDAGFYGSTGSIRLNQPIVGMASAPGGAGYFLVASDGGIFTFGNASFFGSMGGTRLNRPVVGMAPTA
jgi:SpoIID/LytB domain protein